MAVKVNFTDSELEYIKNEYIKGKSISYIAKLFGVSYSIIQNRLKNMKPCRVMFLPCKDMN